MIIPPEFFQRKLPLKAFTSLGYLEEPAIFLVFGSIRYTKRWVYLSTMLNLIPH